MITQSIILEEKPFRINLEYDGEEIPDGQIISLWYTGLERDSRIHIFGLDEIKQLRDMLDKFLETAHTKTEANRRLKVSKSGVYIDLCPDCFKRLEATESK